jgi:predicted acyl esterase
MLDSMSRTTSDGFFDVIERSAEQPWSSGKVGLLGISYYAGSQWRVAARKPKGLAAMVPWEGKVFLPCDLLGVVCGCMF